MFFSVSCLAWTVLLLLAVQTNHADVGSFVGYTLLCTAFAAVIVLGSMVSGNAYRQAVLDSDTDQRFLVLSRDADQDKAGDFRAPSVTRRPFRIRLDLRPADWRASILGAIFFVVTVGVFVATELPAAFTIFSLLLVFVLAFVGGYLYRQRVLDTGIVPRIPALNIRSRREDRG